MSRYSGRTGSAVYPELHHAISLVLSFFNYRTVVANNALRQFPSATLSVSPASIYLFAPKLCSLSRFLWITSPSRNVVSPGSVTLTFCGICLTTTPIMFVVYLNTHPGIWINFWFRFYKISLHFQQQPLISHQNDQQDHGSRLSSAHWFYHQIVASLPQEYALPTWDFIINHLTPCRPGWEFWLPCATHDIFLFLLFHQSPLPLPDPLGHLASNNSVTVVKYPSSYWFSLNFTMIVLLYLLLSSQNRVAL